MTLTRHSSRVCVFFGNVGGPLVRADCQPQSAGARHSEAHLAGSCVEIIVRDQGSGTASDALDRIFDKFYRLGDNDPRLADMGLAIAKEFVEVSSASRNDYVT